MVLRLGSIVLLLASVLMMPWWTGFLLAVVFIFVFKSFWEVMPIFLVSDFIYAVPEQRFGGIVFVSLIVSIFLYILINFVKKQLRA